jgi:ketosteroid isomerase-like protein
MRLHKREVIGLTAAVSGFAMAVALAADSTTPRPIGSSSPTVETALAAEEEIAKAIRENDAVGITRMLSEDWAVITTSGGVGEGNTIFAEGIRLGTLTRKTFDLSEPRVRLYGNIALVTTKVKTSGMLAGRPFDVVERQTDILIWKDNVWKSVLTHETKISG